MALQDVELRSPGTNAWDISLETPAAGTKIWVNINGTWKETTPYVNINGTWKQGTPNVNIGGTWKS